MISKDQQTLFRSQLFRHLDGIVTIPIAVALFKAGVTDYILEKKKVTLSELTDRFKANEGYLNVALRTFCSQNWLQQEINHRNGEIHFTTNEHSAFAFGLISKYEQIAKMPALFNQLFKADSFSNEIYHTLNSFFKQYELGFSLPKAKNTNEEMILEQVFFQLEGAIAGPLIVKLGMGDLFHKYFMEASFRAEEYHEDADNFKHILDFFTSIGWFYKKNQTYQFTAKGLFFAKRASSYGVTVSYLPTFAKLDELIFGNPNVLKSGDGQEELHVDREMNVWGSGGAHSGYFKNIDEILIDLFNRPISEQPKGVLDLGCGNGAFLIHIFDVIEKRTYRGKVLDEHPLLLVGADYNRSALKVSRANLIKADIWAKVVWGDIGKPDLLSAELKEDYNIDMSELLNVRTFLDHNRIWEEPEVITDRISTSTGAFASSGKRISNNKVEDSLLEHFKKWQPYIKKFGLLLIELHTLNPEITSANIGKTPATAYDATHGFSDQYILEADVFLRIAEEAGLRPDERLMAKFPNSELATVTINLFKGI
ncbi:MAG: class I SAM-dependent methyltransferase [Chitinophagaceae bacterium]|nr:MAG: class I SAM-dependent methyltransferase [Chitinophagaceae bacterium]